MTSSPEARDLCRVLGVDRAALTRLVAAYAERGWTVATAESLTAGLLAAVLTEVPGSSTVLRGGVVCYATDVKADVLGVPNDLLGQFGPVHPEVARHLAAGARRTCRTAVGVGLTGVAGPDAQAGRPPGTVFVAIDSDRGTDVRSVAVPAADRHRGGIRAAAVREAVSMLTALLESPEPPGTTPTGTAF